MTGSVVMALLLILATQLNGAEKQPRLTNGGFNGRVQWKDSKVPHTPKKGTLLFISHRKSHHLTF